MDYHSQYNHRWHSPKVKAYASPIHGLGVVAVDNISRGELVFVYGGVIVPRQKIKEYWRKMGHIGIQIEEDFWICPTSREELGKQGVINHSCEPNTGFQNQVTLIAIKDITAGEEIVFDYAFCESFMESFECKCGSSNCRKTISQKDWKLKDIQDKFGKYFSSYLKIKF